MTSPAFRLPDLIRRFVAGADEGNDQESGARRELKYLLPRGGGRFAASLVAARIPSLSRMHPPRRVSSIYFDSATYACYAQSNSGQSERVKMRLRWYGDLGDTTRPVLELKHRANHHGWKSQQAMDDLDLRELSWDELRSELGRRVAPADRAVVEMLRFPILVASYHRHYFVTNDRQIRVTVDNDLRFFDQRWRPRINLGFDAVEAPFGVVECKLDPSLEPAVERLLRPLGLRQTRFSKYCYGLGRLARV